MISKLLTSLLIICSQIFILCLATVTYADNDPLLITHQLEVKLDPEAHHIQATDEITLIKPTVGELEFTLHSALVITAEKQLDLQQLPQTHQPPFKRYKITLPPGTATFKLSYQGKINHPLDHYGKEQARGYRSSSGIISADGVYLSGSSHWYPEFLPQSGITFDLNIKLPKGWTAISQGESQTTNHWKEAQTQEEIYLIAARFHHYQLKTGNTKAEVYLREPDEMLANRYLASTHRYLTMYENLLGKYPYSKFALVENFWETGFGMPSFTLLGSRVIRLPFIIHTSYPHEILHNWWGNGVYVDYPSGNWSEGLTAYLADHLLKQQRGKGKIYRQQTLQKYVDYAANEKDFPLTDFRGRHSSASAAVGYGKSLMLFHMLRHHLGDKLFKKGLQLFYAKNLFHKASYKDIRKSFEDVSGQSLKWFFNQWTQRTGAPELRLGTSNIKEIDPKINNNDYELTFTLHQKQAGTAYRLTIPISISLENTTNAYQTNVTMNTVNQEFKIKLPGKPVRLDIDPEFDLFRKLSKAESPAAFSNSFGSKNLTVLLAEKSTGKLRQAYQDFANQIQFMGPDKVTVQWDNELNDLPENQSVILVGWQNQFLPEIKSIVKNSNSHLDEKNIRFNGNSIPGSGTSIALTVMQNNQEKSSLSFIATDNPEALTGLARKLPHYHKYSYLAFTGGEPGNILKGYWVVKHSPMTILFTENALPGELLFRSALVVPDS